MKDCKCKEHNKSCYVCMWKLFNLEDYRESLGSVKCRELIEKSLGLEK